MANTLRKILFGGLVALTFGVFVYRYKLEHSSRVESNPIGEISDLCKDQEVLGNYPNFLGDNVTIVYTPDVDKDYVDNVVKGLQRYGIKVNPVYYPDLTTPINGNFISIGDPCLNGKTREVLGLSGDVSCSYTFSHNQQAKIEIHDYKTNNPLLVYGNDKDSIRRAFFLLEKPGEFREKLRQFGLLCNKSVTVSGTTYFAVEKIKVR